MRFQRHLWISEQEYLADLLEIERPGKYDSYTQLASSTGQRASTPLEILRDRHIDQRHEKTSSESESSLTAGNESSEDDEEETDEALQWLSAEWEITVKFLKHKEPDCELSDVYDDP